MALIWFIAAQVATGQSPGASEYEVKAAFLYNFAKFVEWPPNTFSDDGPLRFCVVGKDPFGGELETTIQGRTVGGRQLAVWRPHSAEESRHCQVLFVSISGRGVVKELLTELRGAPVLTVGEDREFLKVGGMISFVLDEERVRFEINPISAEREHLKISAKLQALARAIVAEGTGK